MMPPVTARELANPSPARYESRRNPREIPQVLRIEGPYDRSLVEPCARQRPDTALHQFGNGAVQRCVPRRGIASVFARHDRAAQRARRRQAQRSGKRRLHRASPHVLRNAGQLLVRRLLQARRDPLRVGVADRRVPVAERQAVGHRLSRRRRSARHLGEGSRRAGRADHPHRRQQGRALRVGQLLADGRRRPVRPVLGNLLRPRPGSVGWPAGIAGGRRRPLHRDLESRVHAVQPRRARQHDAAAQAVRRHRHGSGAYRRGAAARAQQL